MLKFQFKMVGKSIFLVLLFWICIQIQFSVGLINSNDCSCPHDLMTTSKVDNIVKNLAPELVHGKGKGDAGKIGIIGGSIEYTGAPYFAAISALKIGADLVFVITTESAAPVVKSYSPDLVVYPYLNNESSSKISSLLSRMDVVVIGPGLGREEDTMRITKDIIETCKSLKKPLVIDADGLYVIAKYPAIIKHYPSPGLIMTPNWREAKRLEEAISGKNNSNNHWFNYWGDYVSILEKGETDQFYSSITSFNWSSSEGGSGRRIAGQGDILSGSLGTVYNWALKNKEHCNNDEHVQFSQSIATYAAAKFTRKCNSIAYQLHKRSMTASDMLGQIHKAFYL